MPDIALPTALNKFHLSLLVSSMLMAAAPAFAEDAKLDTVTVISTGLRGQERTVADSPAPIDVINSDQLLKTGRAELSEAIAKLLPSFNFGTNIAGYNSVTRPLSNRSLARPTRWCWSTASAATTAPPANAVRSTTAARMRWTST